MRPVPLRNRAYTAYEVVYVLGPLSPTVLLGLPDAVRALAERDGRSSSMGMPARRGGASDAAANGALQTADAGLDDAALVRAVLQAGRHGRPWSVTVAGDRAAVLVAHEAADGVESMALVEALLSIAAARPVPAEQRPVSWPLARALRAGGVTPFRGYIVARRARTRATPPVTAPDPTPSQASHADLAVSRFGLDSDDLRSLRAGRSGDGRATLSTRLISVALAALATCAASVDDVRVTIPMDARYLLPGTARVTGNFIANEPVGSLHGTDWSPAAINSLLAARRQTALPAVVLPVLQQISAELRRVVRPNHARRREHTVSVSVLPALALPRDVWRDGVPAPFGCVTIGPWPSAAFVFITVGADRASVSVCDESGRYDLQGFESAYRAEIEARLH